MVPFRPDGPLHPDHVRELRAAINAHRANDSAYDICLHGPRHLAADFEDAGVTWFLESCGPEQPVGDVRRIIEAGPPRTARPG